MASREPHIILAHLDQLLKETSWKGPPSDLSHLADPQHLQEFKEVVLGGAYDKTVPDWVLKEVRKTVELAQDKSSFRICSVGCGDGSLDKQILTELAVSNPSLEIQYVGVGLCEQGCEEVEGELEGLAENVIVQVVAKDYAELSKEELGTFNCVLMVSCLCYSTAPEATLKAVLELVKPEGELIVVSSSRQSVDELIARFWKHQRHYDLCTTENVKDMLQKMGMKYSVSQLPVTFDLSQCFNENFESINSRRILDHIVQVNMDEYSPAVSEACTEYLEAIAVGPPEKKVVESLSDMIIVKGKN